MLVLRLACTDIVTHKFTHVFENLQWNCSQMTLLFQEGLKTWAHQIKDGVFLIGGKKMPDETELTTGQVV